MKNPPTLVLKPRSKARKCDKTDTSGWSYVIQENRPKTVPELLQNSFRFLNFSNCFICRKVCFKYKFKFGFGYVLFKFSQRCRSSSDLINAHG